jgi:PKHD-type hydroxylase
MFISILNNILTPERLGKARDLIGRARFVDGRISGGSTSNKSNLELLPESAEYVELASLLENAIREHAEFNFTAYPRHVTRPIVSCYEPGMFFEEHIDSPVMNFFGGARGPLRAQPPLGSNYVRSDLSMTIFLSDPESYSGGELSFKTAFDRAQSKLDAGSGLLYPTGVPHLVRPVTRGRRLAAVFWIQSMLPVDAERRLVFDTYNLYAALKRSQAGSPECVQAERNFFSLLRILAQV